MSDWFTVTLMCSSNEFCLLGISGWIYGWTHDGEKLPQSQIWSLVQTQQQQQQQRACSMKDGEKHRGGGGLEFWKIIFRTCECLWCRATLGGRSNPTRGAERGCFCVEWNQTVRAELCCIQQPQTHQHQQHCSLWRRRSYWQRSVT